MPHAIRPMLSRACSTATLIAWLLTAPAAAQTKKDVAAPEKFPPKPASKPAPETMNGLPLLYDEDFESGASRWEPTDPKAWKIIDQQGNHVFCQHLRKSDYNPTHRSPFNRALLKDVVVGDFVLDLQCQSIVEDYGHRSLCVFFGYQDNDHLHYVHFGKVADDHANQIFIVNDAPRTKISTTSTPGTDWDDEWHHVRIVRKVEPGTIEVYFDNMDKPVMTATDKTFQSGRIGIGSFDDAGNFDDVRLYGQLVKPAS